MTRTDLYREEVLSLLTVAELWGHEIGEGHFHKEELYRIVLRLVNGHVPTDGGQPLIIHPDEKNRSKAVGALTFLQGQHNHLVVSNKIDELQWLFISKANFRLWCIGRFALPEFWFSEAERTTFTGTELVNMDRLGWPRPIMEKTEPKNSNSPEFFPGRPTKRRAEIEQELERRIAEGTLAPSLAAEARSLAQWAVSL